MSDEIGALMHQFQEVSGPKRNSGAKIHQMTPLTTDRGQIWCIIAPISSFVRDVG
jgi:hypothetical protein